MYDLEDEVTQANPAEYPPVRVIDGPLAAVAPGWVKF